MMNEMNNSYEVKMPLMVARELVKAIIEEKINSDVSFKEIWDLPVDEKIYVWSNYNGELDKEDYNLLNVYHNLNKLLK